MGEHYDNSKDLFVEIELSGLIKIDDWFKDGTTIKRTLLKGKGSSPNIDSLIGVYMRIKVNDIVVLNNFPDEDPVKYVLSLDADQRKEKEED